MGSLARVDDGEYRPARVSQQAIERFIEEPLTQIPPEWRLAVYDFWAANSNLLKDQLALAARLRHWIALGLELDDIRLVFGHMLRPENAMNYSHSGELMAALAANVTLALRRKKALQRRPVVEQVPPAGEAAKIKAALARRFAWSEDDEGDAGDRT